MRLGWVIAYSAGLFVISVLGLPCWNAFLKDSVGRFLTVQQLHVVEYAGLGGVAAFTFEPRARPRRMAVGLGMAVVGVGLLDEALQAALPQRYFQWSDVVLNWVGIVVGAIPVWVLKQAARRRIPATHSRDSTK